MAKKKASKEVIPIFEIYKEDEQLMVALYGSLLNQCKGVKAIKKNHLYTFLTKLNVAGHKEDSEVMAALDKITAEVFDRFKNEKDYLFTHPSKDLQSLIFWAGVGTIAWLSPVELKKLHKKTAIINFYNEAKEFIIKNKIKKFSHYQLTIMATYFAYKAGCQFYTKKITDTSTLSHINKIGEYNTVHLKKIV